MNRTAANLTPLLTCPAFLPWHLLGAILCVSAFAYVLASAEPGNGGYVVAFVLPIWSAFVLTSLQRDLLVRPFSFCLPGHREVARRTSFLVGIAAALVTCLPVLTYPELSGLSLVLAFWSAFCCGVIIYLAAVRCVFAMDAVVFLLGPVVPVAIVLAEYPDARILLQKAALFAPGVNSIVMVALSLYMWRWMGNAQLARRNCGVRFLSLQVAWKRSANEEFKKSSKREYLSKRTWSVRSLLLQQCFARISRRPALSFGRHLAATQYRLAGRLVPLSSRNVLVAAIFIGGFLVVTGYAPLNENHPEAPISNAVYLMCCAFALQLPIPMFTTMLLPVGRRERFLTAIAVAVCCGIFVLVVSLLFYLLLLGIGTLIPSLSLGGEVYRFRPADLAPAFAPLVVLPISFALKVTCKKWLVLPDILLFFLAGMFIFKGAPLSELSFLAFFSFTAVCWAILVGVLYVYAFHRDLAGE